MSEMIIKGEFFYDKKNAIIRNVYLKPRQKNGDVTEKQLAMGRLRQNETAVNKRKARRFEKSGLQPWPSPIDGIRGLAGFSSPQTKGSAENGDK
jgi:hypothetical protein